MASHLITALLRPDEFFDEHSGEEAALALPLGIVFVYAILSGIVGYQMASLMAPMYEAALEGYGGIIAIFGGIGGFVSAVIVWVVAAVIFYLLSMIFSGEGSMKKVLEAVGYGIAPLIGSVAVAMVYLAMIKDQVITPVIHDIMDPTAAEAAVEAFMNQQVMADFTLLQTVLSVVFMIWAANIWYSGIRYGRKLSTRNAAITVFIPVGIYLIIVIASYGVI
jgi:hypothetical protein